MKLAQLFDTSDREPLERIVEDGGFTGIFRTIACVGDSLSSGEFEAKKADGSKTYHDYYEYSWGQYLARMTGAKVYNMSCGGMSAKAYCEEFADHWGLWNPDKACQAYIIALGVNDLFGMKQPLGSLSDVDLADYHNNHLETFAGNYAKIIQRYQEIQPRARFFLVGMPRHADGEADETRLAHTMLLHEMARVFRNTYVIDLYHYAPVYDTAFYSLFFLGHMTPCGYLLTAKLIGSYIDYLIRHHMDDFKQVGFIGTSLSYEPETDTRGQETQNDG